MIKLDIQMYWWDSCWSGDIQRMIADRTCWY